MKTTLSGIITAIFPTATRGNFESRKLWLKQSDRETRPSHWEIEAQQTDVNMLDHFKVGDEVTCDILVTGRAWSKDGRDMIFNCLKLTDISYFGTGAATPRATPSTRQMTGGIPSSVTEKAPAPKAAAKQEGWKPATNLPDIDF